MTDGYHVEAEAQRRIRQAQQPDPRDEAIRLRDEALQVAGVALQDAITSWREEFEFRSAIDKADAWEAALDRINVILSPGAQC